VWDSKRPCAEKTGNGMLIVSQITLRKRMQQRWRGCVAVTLTAYPGIIGFQACVLVGVLRRCAALPVALQLYRNVRVC
jgi:hypothetical protein